MSFKKLYPRKRKTRVGMREEHEQFARYFVADPLHSISAASRKIGRGRDWGMYVIRKPAVKAYIYELAGRAPEDLIRPPVPNTRNGISEEEALEAREAQVMAVPSEADCIRVFERLRTFMDFRLVDYLTPPGQPLAISAEKVRALAGTEEGRAIKKLKHKNYKTIDKAGNVTSETDTYEIEIESPLQATQAMAKVLGLDRTDDERKRQQTEEAFEAALKSLPSDVVQQVYLAMMRHGTVNGNALLTSGNGGGKPS